MKPPTPNELLLKCLLKDTYIDISSQNYQKKRREKREVQSREKGKKPMKYEKPGSLSPRVVLAMMDRKEI